MHLGQILHQQRGGPARRLIAPLPGVAVDHRVNQGLNDSMYRARPTTMSSWRDSSLQSEGLARLEMGQPLVDCLSADPQTVSYLLDAFSPIEPICANLKILNSGKLIAEVKRRWRKWNGMTGK